MRRLFCILLVLAAVLAAPFMAGAANGNDVDSANENIAANKAIDIKSFLPLIPEDVHEVFPACDNLRDLGHGWLGVMKADKLIGYAACSKPASDGITGFKGETPLILCFDKERKIIRVLLMENKETPGFVARVVEGGLLNSWNGKTIKEAMKVSPDAISGATYTSRSVIASVQAVLKQLSTVQPSIMKSHPKGFVLTMLAVIAVLLSYFTIRTQRIQQKNMEKAAALSEETLHK